MSAPANGDAAHADIQALAKGGRTNFLGFLLRLMARIPFLLIAGRLYGAEALGRFASALVVVELAAQLATIGQKRGLAQRLSEEAQHPANIIADGMVLSAVIGLGMGAILWLVPGPMFPSGEYTALDLLLPAILIPFALTEIALSALAYRFDVATTVRSRAVVEPWALSIAAAALWFVVPESGLALAYIFSIFAAAVAALIPLYRSYGLPQDWSPNPLRLWKLALANLPLAAADAVEWGKKKIPIT